MNCTFEPIERKDIQTLRLIRNSKEVWSNLSNALMINELEQESWFERQSLDSTKQYYSIKYGDIMVGSIWYDEWDKINSSCRVGIFITKDYQNRGLGTYVFERFIKYLHNDLHIHRIWLMVIESNKTAINLYKKFGFKLEGKLKDALYRDGKFINYLLMGKVYV